MVMRISELEIRQAAFDRLDTAKREHARASDAAARAWEELKRSSLSMVLDHGMSITMCAEVAGVHRNTMKHWVQLERALRANVGEATPVPAE